MKPIFIIGLFLALAAPVHARSTRSGRTAADVMMLSTGCKGFQMEYGVYPPEETWLDELQATSNAVLNTRQIVFADQGRSVDSWGSPFVYRYPGNHNPDSFDLYSLGADGASASGGDDPDDIASWHESGRWFRHYNPPVITLARVIIVCGVVVATIIAHTHKRRRGKGRD